MLAKCANPACSAPFLYLRDGKLYQLEVDSNFPPRESSQDGAEPKPARRLEFFWLCGRCAPQMTLIFDRVRRRIAVRSRSRRAIAS